MKTTADIRMLLPMLGSCPGLPLCDGVKLCEDHRDVLRAMKRAVREAQYEFEKDARLRYIKATKHRPEGCCFAGVGQACPIHEKRQR